ncbi:MAG: hypothetical protein NC311_11630 [Muribaculaceae bacterium]|nr:hypothetical protein [Muribaculaceae bacterium]
MAVTQLLCNNFGGIRERNSVFSEEYITAKDIQNVELYYTGTNGGIGIRTVKGNEAVLNIPNENIINIYETVQNENSHIIIHTETETNGKLYLYNNNELVCIKNDLKRTGESNGFDIAQGWQDYFFFTTGSEMLLYEIYKTITDEDGLFVSYSNEIANTITSFAPKDRDNRFVLGIGACLFDNRLWIFNKNILWYSMQGDIFDFGGNNDSVNNSEIVTTAGYIEELKNITAIHEYLGSLAVFFQDSSILLSISDGEISQSEQYIGGCAGRNALVFHDTNLYFYDDTKKAVYSFQQVATGERTLGENCAVEVQKTLNEISIFDISKIKAISVFIEDRNEIWWELPTTDRDYSTILIYDYLKGEWIKRKSQKLNVIKVIQNKLYSADTKGNLLKEYQSDTFNGEYIQHYYKCTPFNLGSMNTLKIFVFPPRLSFDLPYSNKFFVKYVKNFNTIKKPKIKFIKTRYKNALIWDEGCWDIDSWLSENTSAVGKFPNATFKTLEIEIYTDETVEDFDKKGQTFAIKSIEMSKIKVKQV